MLNQDIHKGDFVKINDDFNRKFEGIVISELDDYWMVQPLNCLDKLERDTFTVSKKDIETYNVLPEKLGMLGIWLNSHEISEVIGSIKSISHEPPSDDDLFYQDRLRAARQYSKGPNGETGGPSGLKFL